MTLPTGRIPYWLKVRSVKSEVKNPLSLFTCAFTLTEMLVVLAIIAMLMSISIPFTSGFGKGLKIKTSAMAILGTLRLAQSSAITKRAFYSVIFDVENSEYWIQDIDGNILEKKYRLSSPIKFKINSETEDEADPVTFENDTLIFSPTGAIEGSGGGSITITGRSGQSKTIAVIGSTGKITIE